MKTSRSKLSVALLVGVSTALLLGGCSKKYTAESDGKGLGESICDLRHSDDSDSARKAADDISAQLGDIEVKYSVWKPEQRKIFDQSLDNLRGHVEDRDWKAAHEDLATIHKELDLVKHGLSEIGHAYIDGIHQGLDGCQAE